MQRSEHRRHRTTTLAGFAALCAATFALAGCGGSTATRTTAPGPIQQARPTPALSGADVGGEGTQSPGGGVSKATGTQQSGGGASQPAGTQQSGGGTSQPAGMPHLDRVVPSGGVQKARQTPSASKDDKPVLKPTGLNPCTLVSTSEAASIAGAATVATDAPLGPTCIYRIHGAKAAITLAVESESFSQVSRQMSHRQSVKISSRTAYCGRLGAQMLFVPLSNGRVLNVTAPCAIAQRFATLALSRLAA